MHLDERVLARFAERRDTPDERSKAISHLGRCEECTTVVASIAEALYGSNRDAHSLVAETAFEVVKRKQSRSLLRPALAAAALFVIALGTLALLTRSGDRPSSGGGSETAAQPGVSPEREDPRNPEVQPDDASASVPGRPSVITPAPPLPRKAPEAEKGPVAREDEPTQPKDEPAIAQGSSPEPVPEPAPPAPTLGLTWSHPILAGIAGDLYLGSETQPTRARTLSPGDVLRTRNHPASFLLSSSAALAADSHSEIAVARYEETGDLEVEVRGGRVFLASDSLPVKADFRFVLSGIAILTPGRVGCIEGRISGEGVLLEAGQEWTPEGLRALDVRELKIFFEKNRPKAISSLAVTFDRDPETEGVEVSEGEIRDGSLRCFQDKRDPEPVSAGVLLRTPVEMSPRLCLRLFVRGQASEAFVTLGTMMDREATRRFPLPSSRDAWKTVEIELSRMRTPHGAPLSPGERIDQIILTVDGAGKAELSVDAIEFLQAP